MTHQTNVLILGGTGLMGRRVAQAFRAAEWTVVVCGRSGCQCLSADASHAKSDTAEVLHSRYWDVVVDFRAMCLDDLVALGLPFPPAVGLWCHISTIYVYGNPKTIPPGSRALAGLTEDSPLTPSGPYGTNKLLVETTLKDMFAITDAGLVICRLPFIFGSHDRSGRAEMLLARLRSRELILPIDGGHEIDLIHASVVSDYIFLMATHPASAGTYNVTMPPAHRVGVHIAAAAKAAGIDVSSAPRAPHPEGLPFVFDVPYYLDATKLASLGLPHIRSGDLEAQWAEALPHSE